MKKLKVYLDNCSFNRPYDNQTQLKIALETKAKLFIQDLVASGKVDLVWSYMIEFENGDNPFPYKQMAVAEWRELSVENISENEDIITSAEQIKLTGIKVKDSLHLACAMYANCDYIITVDTRMTKYQTDRIIIANPLDFIKDWSEKND
jgi:predicted nucleic acid-binding protein